MIVTPKEAASLLCPFKVRGAHCAANACMFWRWILDPCHEKPSYGYCGAAGVPRA